jgi:putative FmdB family regulatory protein
MPDYLYECRECSRQWREVHKIADRNRPGPCPDCNGAGDKVFEAPNPNVFRARWFEGIDSQPVFVESESQLKSICEKNGCYVEKDDRRKQRQYYERRDMVDEGRRLYSLG